MKSQYFAAKSPEELAKVVLSKIKNFSSSVYDTGYVDKVKKCYAQYHGMSYDNSASSHEINFTGEQGEITQIGVNHFRNIAQNMLNLITNSRPVMEARAMNTDYKSVVQTKLANGLLDYYMREKRLEKKLRSAAEYAIAMGTGFIRLEWNATSGEQIDFDEETQTPIYEGDIEFENLSFFDVFFDNTKEDFEKNKWLVVRTFKNKYDLIAKYPEHEDKILSLETKSDMDYFKSVGVAGFDETTDVPVYEFYHERTEALSDGRYTLMLDSDLILIDAPLPYDRIPIYRIAPSEILGSPYGYTPLFDLMAIQDAINMLYTAILTNQNAFAIQYIAVARNSDVHIEAINDGLSIIEYNQIGGAPQPLNLAKTAPETFNFLNMLIQAMETVSGINSVVRGQPEASLRTASSLALMQSNSIQFMSGLAMQYNQIIEDVGSGLLKTLQMYANTKRVAAIVGVNNRSYLKSFTGEDLSNISRVVVSAGNPISRTSSGRLQMASELLQYKLLKNPMQYFAVLTTGNLDMITEDVQKEQNLIISENEQMLEGELPPVLMIDEHSTHIAHHKALIADAKMRSNPQLVEVVMQHINEHLEALRTADPALLQLIGQQSMAPQPAAGDVNAIQTQDGGQAPADLGNTVGPLNEQLLPSPADQLPSGPEGMPVTLTGQDLQNKIQG